MTILGISAGFHDAAVSVIDYHGDIVFAGHCERYSKIKNDPNLSLGLLREITHLNIQQVAYYEIPWLKQSRQLYSGQGIEWRKLTTKRILVDQIGKEFSRYPNSNISCFSHHKCHAAAGFQTSPYDRATVVVIDAIGEWDTITIWAAEYVNGVATYKKLWRQIYPHSIGLFYSSMTRRAGLKPNEEEYILMGMAAYGNPGYGNGIEMALVEDEYTAKFKNNLHLGLIDGRLDELANEDIAAGSQMLAERLILNIMHRAKKFNWSDNLVYMGGVALNCKANARLGEYFKNIWVMPNPGDAGSSLGAAALAYGRKINWKNAYLGHNIPGPYPVTAVLDELLSNRIVGVASGRAEFGPRALGNRSLLADPRGDDIKDQVNEIKQREKFRPFAPVILEELVNNYFDIPGNWDNSRYMQVISECRNPELFPAIVHHDGTSRVQTVPPDGSGIRQLLEKWFIMTGCPMLLNTSLNIKGEPMVNDRTDADRFEKLYGVKVIS